MPTNMRAQESRYERKFVLTYDQAVGLHRLIKTHPAHFNKAYPDRQVNNIYYDTTDFAHFRENIAGVSPRKKVRIRWYGTFTQKNPSSLEIKSKNGEIVSKSVIPFKKNYRNFKTLPNKISDTFFEKSDIYRAVLKNSYVRQYFVTANEQIRLTVDSQLYFDAYKHNITKAPRKSINRTIVELKYTPDVAIEASNVSKYFPFRLSKSSKYVLGISVCYPHLVII